MSKDRQRLIDYLTHMLEAIERVNRYTEDMDELAFLQNELIQDAVEHVAGAQGNAQDAI